MTDTQILKRLIIDKACEFVENFAEGVKLKQNDENNVPKYEVTILGVPINTVIIAFDDNFPPPNKIFDGRTGACKRSDYIMICEQEKSIFCVEMTSGKKRQKEYIGQLNGSKCFVEYLKAIGKIFCDKDTFLEGYKNYFVFIKYVYSIDKRPSRPLGDDNQRVTKLQGQGPWKFDYLMKKSI